MFSFGFKGLEYLNQLEFLVSLLLVPYCDRQLAAIRESRFLVDEENSGYVNCILASVVTLFIIPFFRCCLHDISYK